MAKSQKAGCTEGGGGRGFAGGGSRGLGGAGFAGGGDRGLGGAGFSGGGGRGGGNQRGERRWVEKVQETCGDCRGAGIVKVAGDKENRSGFSEEAPPDGGDRGLGGAGFFGGGGRGGGNQRGERRWFEENQEKSGGGAGIMKVAGDQKTHSAYGGGAMVSGRSIATGTWAFWDYENTAVPCNLQPHNVIRNINQCVKSLNWDQPLNLEVFCDFRHLKKETRSNMARMNGTTAVIKFWDAHMLALKGWGGVTRIKAYDHIVNLDLEQQAAFIHNNILLENVPLVEGEGKFEASNFILVEIGDLLKTIDRHHPAKFLIISGQDCRSAAAEVIKQGHGIRVCQPVPCKVPPTE